MKKILLSCICIIGLTTFSSAQINTAKKEADLIELFKRADLNDDQQNKSKAVLAEFAKQSTAIKTDASLTKEEKASKLKSISEEKENKLKEIMGENQYKAFVTAQQAQHELNLKQKN